VATITTFERVGPTRKFVLLLSVLVFTVVGCAEASHVCGTIVLHSWQHGKASVEQGYPGEGGVCLICAASQVAASPIRSAQNLPDFEISYTLAATDSTRPHSADLVSLYSRPPPAE